jgi:hypothetical protein
VKRSYSLLRLLVLVGCVPLLPRSAQVTLVSAHTQNCTHISTTASTGNCPSGCTSTQYTYYALIGGTGFQYADQVATPCAPSTCTQPSALGPPNYECPQCCLADGQICGANECNGNNPCCDTCYDGSCCTGNGLLCTPYTKCCDYPSCVGGICQPCAYLNETCNNTFPNCCGEGLECMYGTCCLGPSASCPSGTGCCPGYHCQDGICKCNMI